MQDASHFTATFEGLIAEVEEAARRLEAFSGFIVSHAQGSRRLAEGQDPVRALLTRLA